MPENPYGLSDKDVKDLQQIRALMKDDDPRAAKIDTLVGAKPKAQSQVSAPTQSAEKPWYMNPPDWLRQNPQTEAAIGFGKAALQTSATAADLINRIPGIGEYLAPRAGVEAYKQLVQPKGVYQNIGAAGEQMAEMMLPAKKIAEGVQVASKAGKLAKVGAKSVLEALNTGASAALHGQDPVTGALFGGGTALAGEAASAVAPKIAESALGVRIKDRLRGKNPGHAIINDTKGVTPAAVEESAKQQMDNLTSTLENEAMRAPANASINNAVMSLDEEIQKATAENSADTVRKLQKIKSQLTTDITNGQPFPDQMSPLKLLHLKRGIGKLIKTWNPEEQSAVNSAVERVYGALNGEIERTVPAAAELNQRIASLIPVSKRAEAAANSSGMVGELVERLKRPTGALTASAVGAGIGYKEGGAEGAVKGAAIGLAPSLAVNPRTMLTAARAAGTPAVNDLLIPFGRGLFLQTIGTDKDGNLIMRPVSSEPAGR